MNIAFIFFFLLFICWCLLFIPLFIFGLILKDKNVNVADEYSLSHYTLCGVLFAKKRISPEHYTFEVEVVAKHYSYSTYFGYLFLIYPWVYLIKKNIFIFQTIKIINLWVNKQKSIIFGSQLKQTTMELILEIIIKFAVFYAKQVGIILLFIGLDSLLLKNKN